MYIKTMPFGALPDGREAFLYELANDSGLTVTISDLGASIIKLMAPDRDGKTDDIVLGHPDFEGYIRNPECFGAVVGRNSNRIQDARITLGGVEYELERNNNGHNLHSGSGGLSYALFRAEIRSMQNQPMLMLSYTVPDMSDGFPGDLTVNIAYLLTNDNVLMIDYRAVSSKETVINLTNHSYFNLAGHASGPVSNQLLRLDSSFYCPNNGDCIPTGEILDVEATPFDFRSERRLGDALDTLFRQTALFGGFDHNFMLNGSGYRAVGSLYDSASGRLLELYTDRPCVQIYTANSLDRKGKNLAHYRSHAGICFETQTAPNAARMPWLTSPVYPAGQELVSTTSFRLSIR